MGVEPSASLGKYALYAVAASPHASKYAAQVITATLYLFAKTGMKKRQATERRQLNRNE
jgi:hypothetical protein